MTKKTFVSLAAHLKKYQDFCKTTDKTQVPFNHFQLNVLCDFCEEQNPAFDRVRFLRTVKNEWDTAYKPRRRGEDGTFRYTY